MDEIECLLLVEDEPDVRATLLAWLERLTPRPRILEASSAHGALELANQHYVDLVILDWNLGAGINGLELLTSLQVFQPEIIAILVTGYAGLATPLQALRLGVRDYLDKHAGLNEATFLGSVQLQLERLRPRKRELQVRQELQVFRQAVSQALPWLRHAQDLRPSNSPGQGSLIALGRLLSPIFNADQIWLMATADQQSASWQVTDLTTGVQTESTGESLQGTASFLSLAGGEPLALPDLQGVARNGEIRLTPWEEKTKPHAILAIPFYHSGSQQAVLSLYQQHPNQSEKPFGLQAMELAALVPAALGALLSSRQEGTQANQWMAALEGALRQAGKLDEALGTNGSGESQNTPTELVETVRADLEKCWEELLPPGAGKAATELLQEATEVARKYGTPALTHAVRLVRETGKLFAEITAVNKSGPPSENAG